MNYTEEEKWKKWFRLDELIKIQRKMTGKDTMDDDTNSDDENAKCCIVNGEKRNTQYKSSS